MSDIDLTNIQPAQGAAPSVSELTVEAPEIQPESETTETEAINAEEAYFMEDCVKVVLSGGVEKLISYESFVQVMKALINSMENSTIEGFSFPEGVFYFAKTSDQMNISLYYPEAIRNLKYGQRNMDIRTPNIIVSHKLRKSARNNSWEVTDSRYFCTDVPTGNLPRKFIFNVEPRARIWLLPMSNTYTEGNMCYGGNQMPRQFTENNLRGLDWYHQYLWESPFNDDLGLRAIGNSMSVGQWYKKLQDCATARAPFPYSDLHGYSPQ